MKIFTSNCLGNIYQKETHVKEDWYIWYIVNWIFYFNIYWKCLGICSWYCYTLHLISSYCVFKLNKLFYDIISEMVSVSMLTVSYKFILYTCITKSSVVQLVLEMCSTQNNIRLVFVTFNIQMNYRLLLPM